MIPGYADRERLTPDELRRHDKARTRSVTKGKLIVAVDFDGVVHDYTKGWHDGTIYGDVVPGFWDWYIRTASAFEVIIFTSRARSLGDIKDIKKWLRDKWDHYAATLPQKPFAPDFAVTNEKPPSWITIDDRAVTFYGNWEDERFTVEGIMRFKPWAYAHKP